LSYVPTFFGLEAAKYIPLPRTVNRQKGRSRDVRALLKKAEDYYRSGDRVLAALPWRCALSVRTARKVYAAIGRRVERQYCDITRGRAVVPRVQKLLLAARSLAGAVTEAPARLRRLRSEGAPRLSETIRFSEVLLPREELEQP